MQRLQPDETRGPTYGLTARLMHWISALLVLSLLCLGVVMVRAIETDFALKFSLYQLHKSLGVSLLALTALRLAWRFYQPPPPLPVTLAPWEARAARANHLMLYAILILMPLSGWAMVSISTLPIKTLLFGWIPFPHIAPLEALTTETRQAAEPIVKWVHRGFAIGLGCLVLVHVGAALRHHFVIGDGVLRRMWTSRSGILPTLACLPLMAGPAFASDWTVDREKSTLTFEARAGGQIVKGRFETFSANIDFDPAHPESARIEARIAIASLTTGNAQVDQALKSDVWFDAIRFPEAVFTAEAAEAGPNGNFVLRGQFTLRGTTKPVDLPFSLLLSGMEATARADFIIDRKAFGIGRGAVVRQFAVEKDVRAVLNLHARRAEPRN